MNAASETPTHFQLALLPAVPSHCSPTGPLQQACRRPRAAARCSPNLLDQLPRLRDNAGPREADNAGHLHGVPAGPGEDSHRLIRTGQERGYQEGDSGVGQED